MGKRYNEITCELQSFIEAQKLFFVATATANGRINLSPKGLDTLRVMDNNRILWLNLTGSGNETAAHLLENKRITLMFCAFEGKPLILRLYGHGRVIHSRAPDWKTLVSMFPPIPGARQVIDMRVDLVQTSCGMGIPYFDYLGEREQLDRWAARKGEHGIEEYWELKNTHSLDGKPTGILQTDPTTDPD